MISIDQLYNDIYIYQKINNKKRKEKWNNIIIDLIPCLSFANSCFYLNFHHISEYTKIVQDSNKKEQGINND